MPSHGRLCGGGTVYGRLRSGLKALLTGSIFFAMTVTALHGLVATGVPASMDSTPAPNPLVSYTALPSSDPDDGKFMAVAGSDLSTLGGIAVVFYVGIPAGGSNFEVGIFDGDTGNHWDSARGPPDDDTVVFKLSRDPLRNGPSAS